MENEDKRGYLYRHRKLDTNEVFYIGKGTIDKRKIKASSERDKYRRAYNFKNRNQWWLNTVNAHGFYVEILAVNLTDDEASELEILLISEYGRKDCCGGILVNLTDGGEGVSGSKMSEERKKEIGDRNRGENNYWYKINPELHPMYGRKGSLNPYYGKKHSEEIKEKMRKPHPSIQGKYHVGSKRVINTSNSIIYDSVREAAEAEGVHYTTLRAYLRGAYPNKTTLIYEEILFNIEKYFK